MKGRKEKFIFLVVATFFAMGIFVVSVLAALRVSAELSGSFNFSVPQDDFFFEIEGQIEGARETEIKFFHEFNHQSRTSVTWEIGQLNFKENSQGEIDDIVFVFNVVNKNTRISDQRQGRVKIFYNGWANVGINIVPSTNLNNGIELAPLSETDDPTQTDNKATFMVMLQPTDRSPSNSIDSINFEYSLIFEFA